MTNFIVPVYAFMIVAALGMIWAYLKFKKEDQEWGKPVAAVLGVVALILAGVAIYYPNAHRKQEIEALLEHERQSHIATMKVLGQKLAERHPNAKTVLVTASDGERGAARSALTKQSIEEGAANRLSIARVDSLGRGDGMIVPDGEYIDGKRLDELIEKHSDADLLILMVSLPYEHDKLAFWQRDPEKNPKLVLYQAPLGSPQVQKAILSGLVSTVLASAAVPNLGSALPEPGAEVAWFERRYVTVNADNLAEVKARNPRLFLAPVPAVEPEAAEGSHEEGSHAEEPAKAAADKDAPKAE